MGTLLEGLGTFAVAGAALGGAGAVTAVGVSAAAPDDVVAALEIGARAGSGEGVFANRVTTKTPPSISSAAPTAMGTASERLGIACPVTDNGAAV
jgi:hypothetical protein